MGKKQEKYGAYVNRCIFFKRCLDKLKIGRRYIGYYYIVEILDLLVNQGKEAKMFSTLIYPEVASIFSVNACTIERDIRHLINNCWDDNLKNKINCCALNKRPTCCKFIRLIKDFVEKEIN